MGSMQRRKGKVIERLCCSILRAIYPDVMRSANQSGGASMCDVEKTPFWIESKGGKRINLWDALRQAQDDRKAANDDRPVLLFLKRDRTEPVVVMLASEFVETIRKGGNDDE